MSYINQAQSYTVRETTPGSYAPTGRFQQGAQTSASCLASIQPLDELPLHLVVAGSQHKEKAITIFTTYPLSEAIEGTNPRPASIIEYQGYDWVVVDTQVYAVGQLDHVEAIAKRSLPR